MFEKSAEQFGRLPVLVNSAGFAFQRAIPADVAV
jgi:hypothetical protein